MISIRLFSICLLSLRALATRALSIRALATRALSIRALSIPMLSILVLVAWSPASHAVVAVGEEVQLQSLTLSGGGGPGLTNSGSGAVSTAELVIGQAGPVGVAESAGSGVRAELGAIPARQGTIAVPEPTGIALSITALVTLGVVRRGRGRPRGEA